MTHLVIVLMIVAFAASIMVDLNNRRFGGVCPGCGAGRPDRHDEECPWA